MKSRIKRNTKNKEQWVIEEKAYTNPCAWEIFGVHNKRLAYAQHASYTVCWALLMKESFALTKQSTLHLYILLLLTKALLLFVMFFFFLSAFSFTNIHDLQDSRGTGKALSLTPLYHFHPVHRHLDVSLEITAEISLLHISSS